MYANIIFLINQGYYFQYLCYFDFRRCSSFPIMWSIEYLPGPAIYIRMNTTK